LRALRARAGPVGLEAPAHPLFHLLGVVDVDAHRLVVAHALGRAVRYEAAVEALEQGDQLVAHRLHARAPPGPAPAGDEADAVAFTHARLEELGDGGLGPLAPGQGQVDVVEEDHEGAAGVRLAVEVRGHARAWRRLLAGDGRQLHRFEVGQGLGIVVFGDLEVALGEARDGLA